MEIRKEIFLIRNLLLLLVAIAAVLIMKSLAGIMLPLVFALLLSVLYLPLIMLLEKKHFPKSLGIMFIVVITLGIILVVANIFISTVNEIIDQQDFLITQLYNRFLAITTMLTQIPYLEIDASELQEGLNNLISKSMLTSAVGGLLKGAGSFGSSFLMFTLYFIFLLPGMSRYESFILYVGGENNSFLEDYEKVRQSFSTYMGIKTIISSVTGTIAWLICSILGLKFAFFWGFLTFILNFIPSIGSIIATLLPSLMGLILLETYNDILLLFILLAANQLIIGNFLDPKIMGDKLRLNTVAVLFGLVFWGVIWGIPGMLLSVPLSVTLKLFLEKSRSWSVLARIIGTVKNEEKNKIKDSVFKKLFKRKTKKDK